MPDNLNIQQVRVQNNIVDIVKNQSQFVVFENKPQAVYDIYQRYIRNGALDGILPSTVDTLLSELGTQTNLYSGSVFTFSAYNTASLTTIMEDNKYWQDAIARLQRITTNYIDLRTKTTFNVFNVLETKPQGLQYHNCNWNILHGDIDKLRSNNIDALSPDYTTFEFPVTVLQVTPSKYTSLQQGGSYIWFNIEVMHNMGIKFDCYLQVNSSAEHSQNQGVKFSVRNQTNMRDVYSTVLKSGDSDALTQFVVSLDSKLLGTTDEIDQTYKILVKMQCLAPEVTLNIAAVSLTQYEV